MFFGIVYRLLADKSFFLLLIRCLSAYFVRLSADKSIFLGTYPLKIVCFLPFLHDRAFFVWHDMERCGTI